MSQKKYTEEKYTVDDLNQDIPVSDTNSQSKETRDIASPKSLANKKVAYRNGVKIDIKF